MRSTDKVYGSLV